LVAYAAVAAVTALARPAAAFKVFMISSTASDHLAMSAAARTALAQMGQANGFTVDATTDNTLINDANLAGYDVFLSMHLAPFEIKLEQRAAFEHFIQQGKGWVGVHAAGLIIPSEWPARNLPPWDFYSTLMGGAAYVTHPALQMGTAVLEDRTHPATRNMPARFQILDEWYEWSKNPRPAVRVLGTADESTYRQVRPMGDHPMIWACEAFQRALYISIGHDASDWGNASYKILIHDALLWAAGLSSGDAGSDALQDAPFENAPPEPTERDGALDAPSSMDVNAGGSSGAAGGSGGATTGPTTSTTSTTGSGGASTGSGGGSSAGPAASSEGCSCRLASGSSGGSSRASFLWVGLGLVAMKRRCRSSVNPRSR
jgi:type 1 glutamine amidotransferase